MLWEGKVKMKILCHGSNDSGSVLITALLLLFLLMLVILPFASASISKFTYGKKQYEEICKKIELHNNELGTKYEID